MDVSARLANIAAGISVGKVGAATVNRDEILEHLELGHGRLSTKIVNIQELKNVVGMCRNREQKIVFTNGCFDLLHLGHIQYLQQAKELGDVLVLGLNSDSSVRKLKGPQRPLISEQQRAQILAALDCIDYITVFSELDPLNLIRAVEPDVLVKGGDYKPEEVVGREIVETSGGKVVIVPLIENLSTSAIVQNIIEKYTEHPPQSNTPE
jgi:D-beta-D-heptose 7-phosphate kinase/D-beta-D-heptose 1-phosphate adenosyltransferase